MKRTALIVMAILMMATPVKADQLFGILLGDSVAVGGYVGAGEDLQDRLELALSGTLSNQAVSGASTRDLYGQVQDAFISDQADNVFIVVGVNDLDWNWPVNMSLGHLRDSLLYIAWNNPDCDVYVATPAHNYPNTTKMWYPGWEFERGVWELIDQLNKQFAGTNVKFHAVDSMSRMLIQCDPWTGCWYDYKHPDADGYEIMANAFVDAYEQ